jgi:hypothetical protein
VARTCRADLVVLATLADAFPPGWDERAKKLAGDTMGVAFLTREDLDLGARYTSASSDEERRPLRIGDMVPANVLPAPVYATAGPRTITTPFCVANCGGSNEIGQEK